MKIIEKVVERVTCSYCKSILEIEQTDVKSEPSVFGKYICDVYYICPVCKAPNYCVPETFKRGLQKAYEYERIKRWF